MMRMKKFSKRIGWYMLVGILVQAADGQPVNPKYEYEEAHLGTVVRIVFYGESKPEGSPPAKAEDKALADAAAAAAFDRARALNSIFSDYHSASETRRLTAVAPTAMAVSPEMIHVLGMCGEIHERSEGAFDPTIGPLVREWRRAKRRGRLPSAEDLAEARAKTGWARVRVGEGCHPLANRNSDLPPVGNLEKSGISEKSAPAGAKALAPGTVALAEEMRLDFGGIAKGFIADEMLAVLRDRGFSRALIDAGGDLALGDAPPGKAGWRVQIFGGGDFLAANVGVATSGHGENHLRVGETTYSHIVDPATGIGVTHRDAVTVVAVSGALADGWASALSVRGKAPEGGGWPLPPSIWVSWADSSASP